jgi:signal transduction histidine kinase
MPAFCPMPRAKTSGHRGGGRPASQGPVGSVVCFSGVRTPPAPQRKTQGRRRERGQERSDEIAAFLAAVRAVLENRGFADAARAVLGACKAVLGADAGLVASCAADGEGLAVAFLDPGGLALDPAAGLPAPLRRLSARAAKLGRPVFSNHLPHRAASRRAPGPRSVPESALFVPILLAGDVAGLLGLLDKPEGFSAADARLAQVFAEMTAVAMLRSRTVDDLEKKRMRSLARRLVEVQESERRHIARELHDEAGQTLAALRFGLRLLEREIAEGGSVTGRVAELMQRTDAVIDGLHRLAADLRPVSLDHLGLEAALRQYARSAGSKFDLVVRFKARGFTGERLPPAVETALYRVVQEAMTNVVRHARATRVDVLAERRGDRVLVMVEDDGVGFEPDQVYGDHFGLLGMRERAVALGGVLTVESAPGAGTTVVVEVPSADPHPDR